MEVRWSVVNRGVNGLLLKLLRAKDFSLEVIRTQQLSPTMRTIFFRAPEFISLAQPEGGEFLRCWFSSEGRQLQRGYTLCDIKQDTGEFAMHFLVHEPAGPASTWASNARIGDRLEVTSYGSHSFAIPQPEPQGIVFVADAASLPYVNQVVPRVPKEIPVQLWLQQYRQSDQEIPLIPTRDNLTVKWLSGGVEAIMEHTRRFDWDDWIVHVMAELEVVKETRKYFIKTLRLPKNHVKVQAYWIDGRPFP